MTQVVSMIFRIDFLFNSDAIFKTAGKFHFHSILMTFFLKYVIQT